MKVGSPKRSQSEFEPSSDFYNLNEMKSFLAAFVLIAAAHADVSHLVRSPEADAPVVRQSADISPDGSAYQYLYETGNGISGQESGQLKNIGSENEAIEVQGSNQYTAPDGTPVQISYIANEFGYQPQGAHLPTTPAPQPIPEYILRALEYIRTHPPAPENVQRSRPRRSL